MRIKVTLMYDGSAFNGWQIQPNSHTIQGELQDILKSITRDDITIYGSGRTDAGVHALGQVFHFDTTMNLPTKAWLALLNNNSSEAISIVSVEQVDSIFHARFDAIGKIYEYRLNMGPYNPFERNTVFQLNRQLDIESMKHAMQHFIGTHDFSTYNKRSLQEVPDQVRTIHSFELIQEGNQLLFRIEGTGFLRHMVRMIVGSVVAVGMGKITPDTVKINLDLKDKTVSKYNIDPCGLYLVKVKY